MSDKSPQSSVRDLVATVVALLISAFVFLVSAYVVVSAFQMTKSVPHSGVLLSLTGSTVVVWEDDTTPVNVRSSDVMHVIMTDGGDIVSRCQDMGGSTLTWEADRVTCNDVDH